MHAEDSLSSTVGSSSSSGALDSLNSIEKLFEALKLRIDAFVASYKTVSETLYPREIVVLRRIEGHATSIAGTLAALKQNSNAALLPIYDAYVQALSVYLTNLVGMFANYAMHDVLYKMIEDLVKYKTAYEQAVKTKTISTTVIPLSPTAAAAASPATSAKENIGEGAQLALQDNAMLVQKLKEKEEELKKLTAEFEEEARLRKEAEDQQRVLSGKLRKQETAIAQLSDYKCKTVVIQGADSGFRAALTRFFNLLSEEVAMDTKAVEHDTAAEYVSPDKYIVSHPNPDSKPQEFDKWKLENPSAYGQLLLSECVDMSRYCAICELVWQLQKLTANGSNGFYKPPQEVARIKALIYELLSVKRYGEAWQKSVNEVIAPELRDATGDYANCLKLIKSFTSFTGYMSTNHYAEPYDRLTVLGNIIGKGKFIPQNIPLGTLLHSARQVLNSPAAAAGASNQMKYS